MVIAICCFGNNKANPALNHFSRFFMAEPFQSLFLHGVNTKTHTVCIGVVAEYLKSCSDVRTLVRILMRHKDGNFQLGV